VRDLFLLDPDLVFLNHGSFGACPAPVFEEYQRRQRELERNPVEFLGRRSASLLADARAALAEYLGTRIERLVFVSNATTGVNTIARSLALGPGDEVLATDHEYGACDNAWAVACKSKGAAYVKLSIPLPYPGDEAFVELLWRGVTPRTRAIFLSHITSPTALVFPVAAVCRRARAEGLLTIVDGAHAPGQIDVDLEAIGADFYTGNCHKWMCAPKGTAFLYARPDHHLALDGLVVSWGYHAELHGVTAHDPYTGADPLARRHQWHGTRDIAGFLAVPAAIAFLREHVTPERRAACHALAVATQERIGGLTGLRPIAEEGSFAQMVAIELPPCDPVAVQIALFEGSGIEVPCLAFEAHPFVRPAFHVYNSPADADALVAAIARLFAGRCAGAE
jgi:isopenicillin-N epimerase